MGETMIPAIEFDDCYPTDESMEVARAYMGDPEPKHWNDAPRWIRATLSDCAENCCADYDEEEDTDIMGRPIIRARFSTGGWSGAEDIIRLIEGDFFCAQHMVQWRRGGHYIFEFKK